MSFRVKTTRKTAKVHFLAAFSKSNNFSLRDQYWLSKFTAETLNLYPGYVKLNRRQREFKGAR